MTYRGVTPDRIVIGTKGATTRQIKAVIMHEYAHKSAQHGIDPILLDLQKTNERLAEEVWTTKIAIDEGKKFGLSESDIFEVTRDERVREEYAKHYGKEAQQAKPTPAVEPEPAAPPDLTGMGAAIPSEFLPPTRSLTGLKHAAIDAQRAERGLAPVAAAIRKSDPVVLAEALDRMDRDPTWADTLLDSLEKDPRAPRPEEHIAMLLRATDIRNEWHKANRDAAQAYDDGRLQDLDAARARASYWSDRAAQIERVAGKQTVAGVGGAGTEAGRALRIRRLMMREDFTLETLELQKRADNDWRGLTDAERADLRRRAKEHKDVEDALRDRITKAKKEGVDSGLLAVIKRLIADATGKRRRPPVDPAKITRGIADAWAEGDTHGVGNLFQQLARRFIEEGTRDRDVLINQLYGALKDDLPGLTRDRTAEIFSGYGDFRPLTTDEVSVIKRQLRGQVQQILKIKDMLEKRPPLKTGIERRVKDPEERRLEKLVNLLRREFEIPITDSRTQLKSSLDMLKTRLERKIEFFETGLREGNFELARKLPPVRLDAEATRLQTRLDEVRKDWARARFEDRRAQWSRMKRGFYNSRELTGIVRAWMTSGDLSFALRQGKLVLVAHPDIWAKSFPNAIKAIRSEAVRAAMDAEVKAHPHYAIARESGVAFSERGVPLDAMDEMFASELVGKLPIISHSERAYSTFLNKMRMDLFSNLYTRLTYRGIPEPKELQVIAEYVNAVTGRGRLPGEKFDRAAGALATVFFSPRYLASRIQVMLGTVGYTALRGTKATRMLLLAEYGRMAVGLSIYYATLLAAAKLYKRDDVEVSLDRTSADYGKVRMGNTRIDPWTGFQQLMTYEGRLEKGEKTPVGYGYTRTITPAQATWDFTRNKFHPIPNAIFDALPLLQGKPARHTDGEVVTPASMLQHYLVPMSWQDVLAVMRDQGVPAGTAMQTLSILGEGVQTHER